MFIFIQSGSLSNYYWACGTYTINKQKHGYERKNTIHMYYYDSSMNWPARNGPRQKYTIWFGNHGGNLI